MTRSQVCTLVASNAAQNACPLVAISAKILGDLPAGITLLNLVLTRLFASGCILGRASIFMMVLRLCMRFSLLMCPRMVSVAMKVGGNGVIAGAFPMDR